MLMLSSGGLRDVIRLFKGWKAEGREGGGSVVILAMTCHGISHRVCSVPEEYVQVVTLRLRR